MFDYLYRYIRRLHIHSSLFPFFSCTDRNEQKKKKKITRKKINMKEKKKKKNTNVMYILLANMTFINIDETNVG